jgi:D-galactarolactone isomerase
VIIPGEDEIATILAGSAKSAGPVEGVSDCHVQVFGPSDRYPPAAGFSVNRMEDHTVEAYREIAGNLAADRAVLVQPEQYGGDHACLIDSMEALAKDDEGTGRDRVRGVASVRPTVEDRELEDLLSLGMVATRAVMRRGAALDTWSAVDRLAWRVHDFGWDVELEMDGSDLHEVEQVLREWPGRIVLDHIGLFLRTKTLTQRGFKALTRLIDRDKVWVKLSAPYRSSRRGRIDDEEVDHIARALVNWAPERMVWGSDWPHAGVEDDSPETRVLLDKLADWVPEESRRRRILRDNPDELYRFPRRPKKVEKETAELPSE